MPNVQVPVPVVEVTAAPPPAGEPEIEAKVIPSVLASNWIVPEKVPVISTEAAVVESEGLLKRLSAMQALVVPQVDPLAVMAPVELIWAKADEQKNAARMQSFLSEFMGFVSRVSSQ